MPGPTFQVFGHVSGLKIYGRALSAKDAAAAAQAGVPKP